LDVKDREILNMLSNNMRFPSGQIAKQVQLSRQAVDYRIQRFFAEEVFMGSRTVVSIRSLGLASYHFFVVVPAENSLKLLVDRSVRCPAVNAVISYTGTRNLEVSLLAKNPLDAVRLWEKIIEKIDVVSTEPTILLSTLVSRVVPWKGSPDSVLQKKGNDPSFQHQFTLSRQPLKGTPDSALLESIANDAQTSLISLASKIRRSVPYVRASIKSLIRAGIIVQFRPVVNYERIGYTIQTILLRCRTHDVAIRGILQELVIQNHAILWAAETLGTWDYILYVATQTSEEIHHFVRSLQHHLHAVIIDTQVLFAYHEFKYTFLPPGLLDSES